MAYPSVSALYVVLAHLYGTFLYGVCPLPQRINWPTEGSSCLPRNSLSLLLYLHLHLGHFLPSSLQALLSRWRGYRQVLKCPPNHPPFFFKHCSALFHSPHPLACSQYIPRNLFSRSWKILGILLEGGQVEERRGCKFSLPGLLFFSLFTWWFSCLPC